MPRLIDFVPGDKMPSVSWLSDMVARSHFKEASETSWGMDEGGAHRFGAIVHTLRPTSGTTTYSLDASLDWRDRIVLVAWCRISKDQAVFPGGPDDDLFANVDNWGPSYPYDWGCKVGYFGSGGINYRLSLFTGAGLESGGAEEASLFLKLENTLTYPRNSFIFLIAATEPLSQRITPYARPSIPLYSDGAEVVPLELNALQDGGVLSQFASVNHVIDQEVLPFGPALHGDPPVAQLWNVKKRNGLLDYDGDIYVEPTKEKRQMVSGSLRRFFAVQLTDSETVVLDDTEDWRDRMITIVFRWSTNYILPGAAQDILHNTATADNRHGYTGLGGTEAGGYRVNLGWGKVYADAETGALTIHNVDSTTYYYTGMIFATFQLGPRKS